MTATMVKEAWTDERLDDLAKGVGEVRAEVIELRKEVSHVREELGEIKGLLKTMDARFDAQQKYMDARFDAADKRFDDVIRMMQIGFGLIGGALAGIFVVLAALVGLMAT